MEEAWRLTERQKKEGTEVCSRRQGRGGGLVLEGISKTEIGGMSNINNKIIDDIQQQYEKIYQRPVDRSRIKTKITLQCQQLYSSGLTPLLQPCQLTLRFQLLVSC